MAGIPGITENAPQRPAFVNQRDELTTGQGLTDKSVQVVKEVAALLGTDPAVRVSNKPAGIQSAQVGSPTGPTGVPTLDNPDDVKAKEVDLEKLFAYLQLETDKKQVGLAKERIDLQKTEVDARHKDQMEKLDKSLAEMDKAAASSAFSRIFGWIMAAAAVALAVVACVATGGVAIGAVVGACAAVGMAIMNETGAMQSMTEGLANFLEDKLGMSKSAAQIVASVTIAVAAIAITVGAGAGGSAIQSALNIGTKVALSATQMSAQTLQAGMDIGMKTMSLAALGAGGYASFQGYKATESQADVTEAEQLLVKARQWMDESQEELQRLMEQIQGVCADIIEILNSESDTQNEIARQIGSMA